MTASLCVQTAAMLPAFLTGALAVQMGDELDFSEAGLGAAVAFFFLLAAVTSPHAGAIADRLGPRRSLRVGAVLTAVSLLGTAVVARNYVVLLVAMGLGAIGLSIAGPGTKVMVAKGVPVHRHGLAFGIQAGAVPLAVLLGGVAVPAIGLNIGWRWAFALMGIVPLVGFVTTPAIGPDRRHRAPRPATRLGDIEYGPLVMLGTAAALGSAAATTLAAFFVSAATDVGIAEGTAGAMLSVGSAVVIAGRVLAGLAADRRGTDPLRAVATLMAVSTAGYVLCATDSRWLLPAGALFALAAGWSWSGLLVHAVVRHYTTAPGAATGMTSGGLNVVGVVGPLGFGLLVDHVSYRVAFLAIAASALAGSLAAAAGQRRLRRSSPATAEIATATLAEAGG